MAEKQILIVCGEASGDLNAANLVKELLKLDPSISFTAVGGAHLREAGAKIIFDIKDLSVIGIFGFNILKKLPRFFALKDLLLEKIRKELPDAVILVDFGIFNLRLAKELNGVVPTIYYISPKLWASRSGRINAIKQYISKMIVLFKFEEEFYRTHGVNADYVGHPLLDIVRPTTEKSEFLHSCNLSPDKTTIALLPGSRNAEIKYILPVMLKSVSLISNTMKNVQFVIAKSANVDWELYLKIIKRFEVKVEIVEGKTYDCVNAADFCLVTSGTATLETAIMEKPFAIIYKMNILNYLYYRPQVKIPFIGIVNIMAGKHIVPEFIQFRARPKIISEFVVNALSDPSALQRIKNELTRIKSSLGVKGANQRAAKIILGMLNKNVS